MFLWFIIAALGIFLDQLTKYLAVLFLRPVDTVPIIKDVLHLTYSENPGAAFGMLKNNRWIFMTISIVAILAILVYMLYRKPTDKLECLSLSFILCGGIGNMIDRVLLGYVVDFIDFRLINFAIFNTADSFVCVGAGLLLLSVILSAVRENRAGKRPVPVFSEEDIATSNNEEPALDDDGEPLIDTIDGENSQDTEADDE